MTIQMYSGCYLAFVCGSDAVVLGNTLRLWFVFMAKNVANLSAISDCESCVGNVVLLILRSVVPVAANIYF